MDMNIDKEERTMFGLLGGWFIFVGLVMLVACVFGGWALVTIVHWVVSH